MADCKKCSVCKAVKPLFDFLPRKDSPDGVRADCKVCKRASNRRVREANAARLAIEGPKMHGERACTKCKAVKRITLFGLSTSRKDGRHSWCVMCATAESCSRLAEKRWSDPAFREALAAQKRADRRAADPALLARDAERAARAALKADCAAHVAARDAWINGPDLCVAHLAARAASLVPPKPSKYVNPGSAYERAKTAWRRARHKGRLVPWVRLKDTLPVYEDVVKLEQITGIPWHVDHYVPLKGVDASGLHVPANLKPVPAVLNQMKSNRPAALYGL